MSVSIGIGIESTEPHFSRRLADAATDLGYAVSSGVGSLERDVHEGVETLAALRKWKEVFSLKAPAEGSANVAFGIHEELVALQSSGVHPKFFDFCASIAQAANDCEMKRIGIFFATEWYAKDRIRMSYGNVSRLITILSLPGHWTVSTLNPRTGRIEEWDELPFFFELDCS